MKRRPAWFYQQSGVIPFRAVDNTYEVLLITSRHGRRWIIPKGIVDRGLTAAESARKEAYEEAGIVGTLLPAPAGSYQYQKWGGQCTVHVFVLEVQALLDAWPEAAVRQRQWMTLDAAAQAIREPELQHLILTLPEVIRAGTL